MPASAPPAAPAVRVIPAPSGHVALPIALQVRSELVALAYRELGPATLVSFGAALALAVGIGRVLPAIVMWLTGVIGVSAYGLWLGKKFRTARPPAEEAALWEWRHLATTTLAALGWGASVWLFPTFSGGALGIFHALILAGLIAGSTRLLLAHRASHLTFLAALGAPVALRLFMTGDPSGFALGGAMLTLVSILAVAAIRSHRLFVLALTARCEQATLTAELKSVAAGRDAREAELREARVLAEAASRAKGEFLATISHEIRTPMNGVLGMLRILRETPLSAEQRDYLKTAADCAEKLLLLLTDVLDFTKLEQGRLELQQAPFPPAAAASVTADLMHARARDKGLHFDLQIAPDLPAAILGDAARLRQILGNLIGNAIKFTELGSVTLAVTCAQRTATRAELHFTVTDTGIGIDSATLERLFKPFIQGDSALNRRYGGAGLGLAISTRLADAMGGVLQVQSTLNQGTTFRLVLPCRLPDGAELAFAPDEPARPAAPALTARVLVVEDDPVNQQVIELFLKKLGIAPRIVTDGHSAVTRATSETFDAILMDCHLPDIDGLEATRQIRQKLAGGRPVKIIALTANVGKKVRDECLAAGMDDFLTKPVRFETLVAALQRNLPGN
ncbi:MAG: ATP-binding protein [Opitutaceae bacterium]